MQAWFTRHGNTYRVFAPGRNSWTWVIHAPADIRRVLVANHRNYTKGVGIDRIRLLLGDGIMTSEGERWRSQRRMMQPAFHRQVIARFAGMVQHCNAALHRRWAAAAERGEPVNLTRDTSELALEITLRAIFGDDVDRLVSDPADNPFMLLSREPRRDPRFAYEFRQLGNTVRHIIHERLARDQRSFDFLQMLLEARDPDSRQAMTENALLDEVLTLVIAGHETTASALNWAWWLIAAHPDVERRLHAEQDRVGDLDLRHYADLEQLPYAQAVVQEALRLYPPGWLLTRRSIGPDRLAGHALPPGTDVFLSPFVVHRHPAIWDNPERFDPDRFGPGHDAERYRFAYLPFGIGPRHCIGESLALLEASLHLNGAARRFRLRAQGDEPVQLEARINLRPAQDIHMRVEKR
jgi:cytochrome P450